MHSRNTSVTEKTKTFCGDSFEAQAEEIFEDIRLKREMSQHLFLRIKFQVLDFQFGQTEFIWPSVHPSNWNVDHCGV